MADARARQPVKITDPTTAANEARVTAGGNVGVDIGASVTITVDTEMPAAASLADNTANPTVPGVGAFLMAFDGTNWDRVQTGAATGGALKVDGTATTQPVSGTVTADTELNAAAALADAASASVSTASIGAVGLVMNATTLDRQRAVVNGQDSTGTGIAAAGLVGQLDDAATGAVTENQFAPVRISSRRALLVEGVASGTNINVNLAASAATVTVDTELTAVAALADATANPTITNIAGFTFGFNGTTWDRVRTANTGRLQVDVITGGGSDTPTNPVVSHQTSSALAAGSSVALTTAEATSKKLTQVIVWCSLPFKANVTTVDNASESAVKGLGGGSAAIPWTFSPRHRNYITLGATAGLDAFRVNVTNLDNNTAADVYATFYYED